MCSTSLIWLLVMEDGIGETFMPFVDILLKMKMAMKKKAMVLVFYAIFATTYVNPSSIKKNWHNTRNFKTIVRQISIYSVP
jgi:hypothetical protein